MPRLLFPWIAASVLLALVVLQRQRAKVWNRRVETESAVKAKRTQFGSVWLQTTLPRRSMLAFGDRQTGSLLIDPELRRATFHPRHGPALEISSVTSVEMGKRGTDIVNTWIEVHGRIGSDVSIAYVNDGGFLGWRALLSRSNRKLASVLRELKVVGPSQ